jgi:hypothetical protein
MAFYRRPVEPEGPVVSCPRNNVVGRIEECIGYLPDYWHLLDDNWVRKAPKPPLYNKEDEAVVEAAMQRWVRLQSVERGETWSKWRKYKKTSHTQYKVVMTYERAVVLYERERALVEKRIADEIEDKMTHYRERKKTGEEQENDDTEEWQPEGDLTDPYTFRG